MLKALNVFKNKLHGRYFAGIFVNKYSWERHRTLFFDSCFNGRPMLKQLNDLNSKWNEFIKMMPSFLLSGRCDILVVDKDLSKVVKTDQESSPVLCYLHRVHLFASHPFNFNKHVFLLYSDVWSNQSLKVCRSLFIMLKNNYMM